VSDFSDFAKLYLSKYPSVSWTGILRKFAGSFF